MPPKKNQGPTEYILYKNAADEDIITIVKYLHSQGISLIPKAIFERGYPLQVTRLPSIYDMTEKVLHHGLDECIKFFEKKSKIKKILDKSKDFKIKNPDYSINS
jgi:hypothetical protein